MRGTASGAWKLEGDMLVLDNKESTSPLVHTGERETAQVTSVTKDVLKLDSKTFSGRHERYDLYRGIPFVAGKNDKPKIVGFWKEKQPGRDGGLEGGLVLEADGQAVIAGFAGRWSQAGDTLVIDTDPPPDTDERPPAMRPDPDTAYYHPDSLGEIAFTIVSVSDSELTLRAQGEPARSLPADDLVVRLERTAARPIEPPELPVPLPPGGVARPEPKVPLPELLPAKPGE